MIRPISHSKKVLYPVQSSIVVVNPLLQKSVAWSLDYVYRYFLWTLWDTTRPLVLWILLNPSIASLSQNDPTVSRCMQRSQILGFGEAIITNAFAYRSTDPKQLYQATNPIGPDNNYWLRTLSQQADQIICGWGSHGAYQDRDQAIQSLLKTQNLYCLGQTQKGQPKHPLYLSYRVQPELFQYNN